MYQERLALYIVVRLCYGGRRLPRFIGAFGNVFYDNYQNMNELLAVVLYDFDPEDCRK